MSESRSSNSSLARDRATATAFGSGVFVADIFVSFFSAGEGRFVIVGGAARSSSLLAPYESESAAR